MLLSREATCFSTGHVLGTLHDSVVAAYRPVDANAARSVSTSITANLTAASDVIVKIVSGGIHGKPQL